MNGGNMHKGNISLREVDNPYFNRAHTEESSNPRKIWVAANTRESAVASLVARGKLNAAQEAAADRFRRLWEVMGGAGAKAIDYTKEPVDGGAKIDPLPDRMIGAGQALDKCRLLLGARNYDLVCAVCGEGRSFGELARTRRDRTTMADNLRASLDDLGRMWGLTG